ncbi:hypothetical protein [Pontibacter sp. BAB1700]|uniref:hypothetical protein n=1 Tax=Pontibacter sp. BAB1700 TaxID=1144253 RepID=UPI0012DCC887|nr:hypothetical protein [Pontibacter sp. BAB1700]
MEITTLLGADILSKYKLLLDYRNTQVSFSKQLIDLGGGVAPISSFMGIPIINLTVAERTVKCFLDTGAKLSYLSKELTQNYESVGAEADFYPGVGKFTTDCYSVSTTYGGNTFDARFGNLPDLPQMTFMLAGTNGIIGYDFFDNFKVMLDLQKGEISTLKYVQAIS